MKILMTTDTAGGVWSYAIHLSELLSIQGIQIVLAAMGTGISQGQRKQIEQLQKKGVKVVFNKMKLEWMEDSQEDIVRATDWIWQLYKSESPDLIHLNNYGQVTQDWDVPTVLVAHSCIASWWKAVKRTPLPFRFNSYFRMVSEAFEQADAVVSPTYSIQKSFQKLYGVRSNQLVIYNAVRRSHQIYSPKRKILFAAGRIWDEGKNISLLLDAAKNIKSEIYIAGPVDGNYSQPANVTFLGELSKKQVSSWMRMAMAYVLPVKYEPFGLSFLEAASHSTALIGGNIDTLKEIWGDAMTYVNPFNVKELTETCNALTEDMERTIQLGKKAYQRSGFFSEEEMVKQYQHLYNSLLYSTRSLLYKL